MVVGNAHAVRHIIVQSLALSNQSHMVILYLYPRCPNGIRRCPNGIRRWRAEHAHWRGAPRTYIMKPRARVPRGGVACQPQKWPAPMGAYAPARTDHPKGEPGA